MFTGIVHSTATIKECQETPGIYTICLEFSDELLRKLEIGASVAIDGVCLTVTSIKNSLVCFDIISSTQSVTTLSKPEVGQKVNVERSMKMDSEVGGHEISGHVDCTAEIKAVEKPEGNFRLLFSVKPEWVKYIFPKGFIAVNGVSLTVGQVNREELEFDVWLIPETLKRTNLQQLTPGDRVNIEIHKNTQVLVDTINEAVKSYLSEALSSGKLDPEKLKKFIVQS